MIQETMQGSLFETPKLSKSGHGRNTAVAFGVTKTGLLKGKYGALENIFHGMHNLKISPEMASLQNPAEILAKFFAANKLKKENAHFNFINMFSFFELIKYMNSYSYEHGFGSLANNFKKIFDTREEIRLWLLDPKMRYEFVTSFFSDYNNPSGCNPYDLFSHDFDDPNRYGEYKGIYTKIIHDNLKNLSEKAKELPVL